MTIAKTGKIYPEIFRFTMGDFEITTILDGLIQRDGPYPIFGQNVNENEVHRLLKEKIFYQKDNLNMALHQFL